MTSLFSHDDAVGVTLNGAKTEFEKAARLCRWAGSLLGGGPVPDEEIIDELNGRKIEPTAENIALVRAEIDRLDSNVGGVDRQGDE